MGKLMNKRSARVSFERARRIRCPVLLVVPEAHALSRYFGAHVNVQPLPGGNHVKEWEKDRHRCSPGRTQKLYAKSEPQTIDEFFRDYKTVRKTNEVYFVCGSRLRVLAGLDLANLPDEFNSRSGLLYQSDDLLIGFPRIIGDSGNYAIAYPYKKRAKGGTLKEEDIQWQALFDDYSQMQLEIGGLA